ncbi:Tn7 transposase TnsA N-terminal domain-containing protein [Paracoccus caeni]|uniref:Tn7 transposase TnsA N-terminal domain-containing protein n=1 Tax=Paracoccus caeni TaxID=657651 RepID=A0A934SJ67_9RHOB|nr:TnsA endonuclease N-terminal domain-containing protein [Paracoccus caeni]MBK4218081.1 Tn7 transposase TnsA N-terminal domain-containing protein [Paracoccus caeni]
MTAPDTVLSDQEECALWRTAAYGHSQGQNIMKDKFSRPRPSRATRKPAARSKASSRGLITGQTKADPIPRLHHFESKLEQAVLFLLLARRDVMDIREQPPAIQYLDAHGRTRIHTFDFLVTLDDGRRIAIDVKPAAIAERNGFRNTLKFIRAATPLSFADDIVLVTERSFCPSTARNAEKLHDFRRTKDGDADMAVADLISNMSDPMSIAELVQKSGLGGRAFRAAFRAIYAGLLRTLDAGDILPVTRVMSGVAQ